MHLTITPKLLVNELIANIQVDLVSLVTSSPGMGKSSLVAQVAEAGNLKIIDVRLSQCMPEDLQGYPMRDGDVVTFKPFDMFPLEDTPLPEGYDGWLLFFDELTSSNKQVQAAAYRPILDHEIGSHKLHPKCAIVCAGNKMEDKAVVNALSTALQSRVIHYELEASIQDWTEWAVKTKQDSRIISYLNFSPDKLMSFNPKHNDKTFRCPRTWEFASRRSKGVEDISSLAHFLSGTLSTAGYTEFKTFCNVYKDLPSYDSIVADPDNAPIHHEASTQFATIGMLIENTDIKNDLDEVLTYVARFNPDMRIVFMRAIVIREPSVRTTSQNFITHLRALRASI